MDLFANLPICDADVAFECASGDFPALASQCERVAEGTDGAFEAGSFVMTSAFPFATQGVQAGHVLVTTRKAGAAGKPNVADADMLPVVSAADGELTVGRFGYPAGQGAYPRGVTPSSGVTGIYYFVPSLLAQIGFEYAELLRHLGIVTPADVRSPADLRKVVILEVLADLYFAQWRTATDDVWKAKHDGARKQIAVLLDGLHATYGDESPQGHRPVAGMPLDDPRWGCRVPDDGSGRWRWDRFGLGGGDCLRGGF